MTKKSMIAEQKRPARFSVRECNRCKICDRPHGHLKKYGTYRAYFKELAYKGEIPGVGEASW